MLGPEKKLLRSLEKLYSEYNKRKFVHPDPLEFLYNYKCLCDKEVVGLIASSLAYGRVQQILKSVSFVLNQMGKSPRKYLEITSPQKIKNDFKSFKHRFTTGEELSSVLIGIKKVIEEYDSLENLFKVNKDLNSFIKIIKKSSGLKNSTMLSDPSKNSACKRLNLFLRWMIRKDDVDPGGWKCINPSELIVPLDTHMFQISRMFGFTCRKQADLKTAVEVTNGFKQYCKDDPVKYDFVLTRFGIRSELDYEQLKKKCMI